MSKPTNLPTSTFTVIDASQTFYLSRVEPPLYYRAPSTIQTEAEAVCKLCGEPILPGQIIADWEDEYYHQDCVGND